MCYWVYAAVQTKMKKPTVIPVSQHSEQNLGQGGKEVYQNRRLSKQNETTVNHSRNSQIKSKPREYKTSTAKIPKHSPSRGMIEVGVSIHRMEKIPEEQDGLPAVDNYDYL
jgi:hypothetical protein